VAKRQSYKVIRWCISAAGKQNQSGWLFLPRCLVKLCFVTLLLCDFVTPANAQQVGIGPDNAYYPVKDLENDWQVYDEDFRAYVPYLPELHSSISSVSVFIDVESNRNYKLLLFSESDSYLFINAALRRKLPAKTWAVFSIDSLYRVYQRQGATQPEIFLTVYGTPGITGKQLFIGYPKASVKKIITLADDNLSVRPRTKSAYSDLLGLVLLFLLATHAFLYTFYRRPFLRFYNPRDLVSVKLRDETVLIGRPLSLTAILFTLNLTFVLAYLVLVAQSQNTAFLSMQWVPFFDGHPFLRTFLSYGIVCVVVFGLMLAKYVMLQTMGSLYKLDRLADVHYFKVIQSSSLFFTAMAVFLSVLVFNFSTLPNLITGLLVVFVGFYLARLLLLYIVLQANTSVKSLYLISYLCIVELVPLLIGLRFAL
jgi:hypothetical protein